MRVLFYMARPGGRAEELLSALSLLVPRESLEVFSDLQGFAERIRGPEDPASIAIIWNPAPEDLRNIGSMRDLLRGGRTLLVLPDEKKETVTLAHSLRPAFITYVDDGISEVLSVLKKLTKAGGNEAAR